MVETISAILQRLVNSLQSNPNLYDPTNSNPSARGLTSTSAVARFRSLLETFAIEFKVQQEAINQVLLEAEGVAASAIPNNEAYYQKKIFEFQYSATSLQIAQLLADYSVGYPTIDETLRIITQCSVKTDFNRIVNVKVAKGGSSPVALSSLEYTALQAYIDLFFAAGTQPNLISATSDKLWIQAEVWYNGQYAPTIQNDVLDAMRAHLATYSLQENFDGVFLTAKMMDAIQAVPGVTDVYISGTKGRPNATAFGSAFPFTNSYIMYAGYMEEETTAGQTWADTITFNVQQ